jgi:quaternary ammonium compound-resistance protein SugE
MASAWVYLIIAGVFEMGWPLGFKLSQVTRYKIMFIGVAVVSMALSGLFLWLAQRNIPIGTAYAVWTGIGAVGTFLLGMVFFGDPVGALRLLSFMLIVVGVIGLKLS